MLWIISLRLLFMFWLCIKALLAIWKRIFWKRIDLFPFSFLKISPHPSAGGQSTKMVNWVREKEKQPLTFRSKAWVLLQAGLAVIDCIKHKHFHRTSTSNQAPLWLWWIKTKKKKKKTPPKSWLNTEKWWTPCKSQKMATHYPVLADRSDSRLFASYSFTFAVDWPPHR